MMTREKAKAQLREAAQPVLERIRRDSEGAGEHVRKMLGVIAERLFDSQLSVAVIVKATGVRDNALALEFHRTLELPPKAYLEECRLETAMRLLRDSADLGVSEIGKLVGFMSLQGFSQAFERWIGHRPTVFRENAGQLRERGLRLPDGKLFRFTTWQRLEKNKLERAAVRDLLPLLEAIYGLEPDMSLQKEQPPEELLARAAWWKLRSLPALEASKLAAEWAAGFKTPALVSFLLETSRLEGRQDRQRAVWIAEIAVEAILPLVDSLSAEELRCLFINGLVCLANVRRQAGDLDGSRSEFERAKALLAKGPATKDLETKLFYLESYLAICERDFTKAHELAERACNLGKRAKDATLRAHALLARGKVRWYLQDYSAAVEDLMRCADLLEGGGDPYLRLAAEQNLALALSSAGSAREARGSLDRARALAQDVEGQQTEWPHLDWLEGLVSRSEGLLSASEVLLKKASREFARTSDFGHLAIVSLDLALLFEAQNRFDELCHVMVETLPILDTLGLEGEGRAALLLLRRAVEGREIRREILLGLREHLTLVVQIA